MDRRLTNLFLFEIKHQCKFANLAFEDLKKGLSIVLSDNGSPGDSVRVWYSLQGFLIAEANISKIFWPDKKYYQRGEDLRKLLSIDDTSILKIRDPRNRLEHFDEKLEEWYEFDFLL